jgi:hypothetical protein
MSEGGKEHFGHEYEVNSHRAHLSAYVLVAGLVLELVNAVVWYEGPRTLAEMAAVLLIVGGVWGEVLFGHRARIAGDNQLAEYEARAAEANQKAQEAALSLERFRAPRALDTEQQARMADKLSQFHGTQYCVGVNSFDPEYVMLVINIEDTLAKAGWLEVDWPNGRTRPGKTLIGFELVVSNVWIAVGFGEVLTGLPIAKALAEALSEEGIETFAAPDVGFNEGIRIIVGRKK